MMCLAVPAQVSAVEDGTATVITGGISCPVSTLLLPAVRPGDWVLVHAGFILQTVDAVEAAKTLALYNALAESWQDELQ